MESTNNTQLMISFTYLIVRKTRSREERNLLSTSNRVHGINSRNTSLNHLLGISTSVGVDRLTINIQVVLSQHRRSVINSNTGSVEGTSKHFLRTIQSLDFLFLFLHSHLHNISSELAVSAGVINSRSSLKHLDNSLVSVNFQNLTLAQLSRSEAQINNLRETGSLHISTRKTLFLPSHSPTRPEVH